MKKTFILVAAFLTTIPSLSHADAIADLLGRYQQQGAGEFSAKAGEALWSRAFTSQTTGEQRKCSTCHLQDLRLAGKHHSTGKLIEPMAPSVNRLRLTDAAKIEKWFARNCKWTFGRECSAQEKGDFLAFIRTR